MQAESQLQSARTRDYTHRGYDRGYENLCRPVQVRVVIPVVHPNYHLHTTEMGL